MSITQYKFTKFNEDGSIMFMQEIDLQIINSDTIIEKLIKHENKYNYIYNNNTSTNLSQILKNLKEEQIVNHNNLQQIKLLLKITQPLANNAFNRARYNLLQNQYYIMYKINMNNIQNLTKLLKKVTLKSKSLFI